jgi:hypothetical protein
VVINITDETTPYRLRLIMGLILSDAALINGAKHGVGAAEYIGLNQTGAFGLVGAAGLLALVSRVLPQDDYAVSGNTPQAFDHFAKWL